WRGRASSIRRPRGCGKRRRSSGRSPARPWSWSSGSPTPIAAWGWARRGRRRAGSETPHCPRASSPSPPTARPAPPTRPTAPPGCAVGWGMTGAAVNRLAADEERLNRQYVQAQLLGEEDAATVASLLQEHVAETASPRAQALLEPFDPGRFLRITTRLQPEPI